MKKVGTTGLQMNEPVIFERSVKGRKGVSPIEHDVPKANVSELIPARFLRSETVETNGAALPEVSELEVVRHYTRLSQWNFGVDSGFYPLGSCTMKYNPKVNEDIARLDGFTSIHPYLDTDSTQGALQLMYELEEYLAEITGMDGVTLQPSAGAHGELCGLMMIAKCLKARGETRTKVLIPDTAHGTNPASSQLAGFKVVKIASGTDGCITLESIEEAMDSDVAALMLTNPNTLGLFEHDIVEIAKIVHSRGGFVFCDGANMNALMGLVRLGDLGVDVVQLNLHKTFSTPHGGGGPGSGPVGVKAELAPYLPVPRIKKDKEEYTFEYDCPDTIGRLKAFYGNFAIMVRAYSYIRRCGPEGLRRVSEIAILNANYIKERLKATFELPHDDKPCMHEAVFSDATLKEFGVSTMDVAKRLIDYGIHPPTVYFPLVVGGAIMIEPTETESKAELDGFIEAMEAIAAEAKNAPELLHNAPTTTRVSRVDETRAAREPRLVWQP
ncbi:MAG: aminomethyl-transferring glycine dehydrogenase subunit GcvPB [Proteobacteria bacterium]|nr:aminomethyl-transferring glycine dehydrogenase subunit GcvPB [Pseudomonadota bacterium]